MTEQQTRPLQARAVRDRPPDLEAGQLVGAWQVVRVLSRGGFGTVYEVQHRETRHRAALKLLHAHLVASPDVIARFDREIDVVSRVRHPNVVQLVDAGFSDDGRPFLCMELLGGQDLHAWLSARGPVSPALAVEILGPICDALAAAHDRGIVHRDVKSRNVFVCWPPPDRPVGRIVLLDFGLAKLSDALAPELTATNQYLGTPACMAPEQIVGAPADARTDVYALGVLLYQLLTGQLPFDDSSPSIAHYLHQNARRPQMSALVAGAAPLDEVVVRAMAVSPADRFAGPHEMLAAAHAALAAPRTTETRITSAILVTVRDANPTALLDETFLDDLEGVLSQATRFLDPLGFTLALDLGSSFLFVARSAADPLAAALKLWDSLQVRPAHPRVRIGVCAHHGPETDRTVLHPTAWGLPVDLQGVWITRAIDPAAHGKRVR